MASSPAPSTFALPALYNFPPFFTLQPVDDTRSKQLEEWKSLILRWHAAHTRTDMSVREWPLWENKAIERRLSDEGIAAVMAYVQKTGGGEWLDDSHAVFKIFARSPADWASAIHAWVTASGLATGGTVYTLYELHSGAVGFESPCQNLDPYILFKALEVLERSGLVSGGSRCTSWSRLHTILKHFAGNADERVYVG